MKTAWALLEELMAEKDPIKRDEIKAKFKGQSKKNRQDATWKMPLLILVFN